MDKNKTKEHDLVLSKWTENHYAGTWIGCTG